jgi:hypothetical protein
VQGRELFVDWGATASPGGRRSLGDESKSVAKYRILSAASDQIFPTVVVIGSLVLWTYFAGIV